MTTKPRKTSILSAVNAVLGRFLACSLSCAVLCTAPANATPAFETVYSWAVSPNAFPESGVIQGTDGNYYGTTRGDYGAFGTVFKMTPAGVVTTLVQFTGLGNGSNPHAGLVQGTDGNFYGTTAEGGANSVGTVFKVTPAGVLTTLLSFTDNGSTNKGSTPEAALVQRADGNFYGTTTYGGTFGAGTAFKVTPAGVLTTLVNFGNGNGLYPVGGLTKGADGNLYGTTFGGGTGFGTVFKMTATGTVTTLVSFTNNGATKKGANPYAGLVQGTDNNFYGTTQYGGSTNQGTIFKTTPTGTLTTLVEFTGNAGAKKGSFPQAGLVQASDGNFYGSTPSGGASDQGTIFKVTSAGALTTLLETNSFSTGINVYARLLQGSDGKLYGTMSSGGIGGLGTVFKITTTGTLTTLVNFGKNVIGRTPGALVKGNDGNFYGRTQSAGTNGMGTIFKITRFGVLTTLVELSSSTGSVITDSFVKGTDGNFYGIKSSGLFKMTPAGAITTLGSATSLYSASPLIQATNGNFYGTRPYGNASDSAGEVFRLTPAGVPTTLAEFIRDSYAELGTSPSGLLQASDGNFYGTTQFGPSPDDSGSVFKMTPTGAVKTLVSFSSSSHSDIIQGTDGNFYGTTQYGGTGFSGTAFKVTPAGVLTTIANFTNTTGAQPSGKLIQRSNGNFFGLTNSGGANFQGTFFRMTPAGALTALLDFTAVDRAFITTYYYGSPINLVLGDDGNYYASTANGGNNAGGGVFRIRFGPTPVTQAATSIASSSATLHGTINPNGLSTTVSFQIGTAATLVGATSVSAGTLPADTAVHPVNHTVTGLLHNKKYYFRIVGQNSDNSIAQTGAILSFTTKP